MSSPDPAPPAQPDVDRLAAALHAAAAESGLPSMPLLTVEAASFAAAILAHPDMQEWAEKAAKWDRYYSKDAHDQLEREAEVGRAVERLPVGTIVEGRVGKEWKVIAERFGTGPTLPAAIAAALGEGEE